MLFCIIFFTIVSYLVNFVENLENSLSVSVEPGAVSYRIFTVENRSIFDEELVQKFIIFNSKNERKIHATFGDFSSKTVTKPTSSAISVQLHTDRHAFLIPTESNKIVVNTLCEFFYTKSHMSFLDAKFCCFVELHLNREFHANPTASCQMRLGQQPSLCFTPLTITDANDLPPVVVITATVHRLQSGVCSITTPLTSMQSESPIYAISAPIALSFSDRPPLMWKLADFNDTRLLLGLPIHSSRPGENLRIVLRMLAGNVPVASQIVRVRCIVDDRINVKSMIPNSPIVTVLNNFSFYNSSHSVHNFELRLSPGRDRELFALNVTLTSDSLSSSVESFSPTIQCCLRRSFDSKQRKANCGRAQIVTLPVEINSMIIIPALKTSGNVFSIYKTPKIALSKDNITVYGVVNYRDRSVSLVSEQVKVSVMDKRHVTIADNDMEPSMIDMQYQNIINSWSIQLSIYDCRYTVLSPVNVWRADSWRLVLSDQVLRPIKNWLVPRVANDRTNCVSRYKVARLKILCRLYMLDESGRKHYAGSDSILNSQDPFIDVTESTMLSQFRIDPPNIVTLEKSQDNGYFMVSANEISQTTSIELLYPESSLVITSSRISVDADQNSLYIVDLLIHCVDALILDQLNKTARTIRVPDEYESITVSMSLDSQSLPCYLLVFLVFNDKSVERLSSFDHSHYQMFLINSQSQSVTSSLITDGQLVTVKWKKNANISVFESSSCNQPKLIFSKKINWGVIVPLSELYIVTNGPSDSAQISTWHLPGNSTDPSNTILQSSLYITIAILALFFLCLILYKIVGFKHRSHHQSTAPTCYNISDSGFLTDHNKAQIKHSNSKNFSSLGKCSTICIKTANNKGHCNEPYPPLLPPPGPISANYDLTLNDPICCDSAVDSGIELGKLSNYSSNTNPSNDLCCSIEQHMSTSMIDDNPYRQPPPPPPQLFASSLFGYYPHKDLIEAISNPYNDKLKSISNLRPPQW